MGNSVGPDSRLKDAITHMRSLHAGDGAVIDVIACGKQAIAPLRIILFERETSGLFEVRCRAVQALVALGAYDVLKEFLGTHRATSDAIERLGDDAVMNAAARALARKRNDCVFDLLLTLALKRLLPGVVAALGSFDRVEAIPRLIEALTEDECRPFAEVALRRLGKIAYSALLTAAAFPPHGGGPSQQRQYRSILGLLDSLKSTKPIDQCSRNSK